MLLLLAALQANEHLAVCRTQVTVVHYHKLRTLSVGGRIEFRNSQGLFRLSMVFNYNYEASSSMMRVCLCHQSQPATLHIK